MRGTVGAGCVPECITLTWEWLWSQILSPERLGLKFLKIRHPAETDWLILSFILLSSNIFKTVQGENLETKVSIMDIDFPQIPFSSPRVINCENELQYVLSNTVDALASSLHRNYFFTLLSQIFTQSWWHAILRCLFQISCIK